MPFLALAATNCPPGYISIDCPSPGVPVSSSGNSGAVNLNVIAPYSAGIINFINGILVPILMAVALITFLWGVYKYFILGAADEKSRIDGRQFVLWGIIGFIVILAMWGLVYIIANTLGLRFGEGAPPPPRI